MENKAKITNLDSLFIPPKSLCKVVKSGNVIEILYQDHINIRKNIENISDDQYIVLSTGEVKSYQHEENRMQRPDSLRRSFQNLRNVINANSQDTQKLKWVTLTYAENMKDDKRLSDDLHHFTEDLREKFGRFEYIAVREPQGRGAWHQHLLLIYPEKAPYIRNQDLQDIWGHGITKTKKCANVDNLGAYLTAYLTDMPLSDAKREGITGNIEEKKVDGKQKKFVKGARLALYPVGMNYYTCSQGVKRPEIYEMRYEDAKKMVEGATSTMQKRIKIEIDEFTKIISDEYYNLK